MLRLHLLGGISIQDDERPLSGAAAQPRRLAVLALVACAGERGLTRDKLLALLWPDADEAQGRRALTQALYALRRDLGAEEAIVGNKHLRLDPGVVRCDASEFEAALSAGEPERAVALYGGALLDGFRLPNADAFDRWLEQERARLARRYAEALGGLAAAALERGDAPRATTYLRRLAAHDPLDTRTALRLMEAMAAAGDRAGALRHARIHAALVEQELGLPPDTRVAALAQRLQEEAAAAERAPAVPAVADPMPTLAPASAPANPSAASPPTASRPRRRRSAAVRVASIAVVGGVILAGVLAVHGGARTAAEAPVLAIGRIADYRAEAGGAIDGAMADLLATDLARAPGLHVVSTARMYELLRQLGGREGDPADAAAAARQAGATQVIEGAVFRVGAGRLRLDLRRTDLATGRLLAAYRVEGGDVFALADSGTAQLAAALGAEHPRGSIADATTHSATAYRLYEQGLRAYVRGDRVAARQLLDAAFEEDTTFAAAAYYGARALPGDRSGWYERASRAVRLADRAPDRERLVIRGEWALGNYGPELAALADTLVVRYPHEVEGYLYAANARMIAGEFLGAIPYFRTVVAMDSLGLRGDAACAACDALGDIVIAYQAADSFPAAEREARLWTRRQPRVAAAWHALAGTLLFEGRPDEAHAAELSASTLGGSGDDGAAVFVVERILRGDFAGAEQLARGWSRTGDPGAPWTLAIALRTEGRIGEALEAARAGRANRTRAGDPDVAILYAMEEAQLLLERGRPRAAAALFDTIAAWRTPDDAPSYGALHRAWALTHVADARAAAGDTASLAALADTVQRLGMLTASGRHRRLHHHVRGLLLAARHEDEAAVAELREAIHSPTIGFSRTNLELARALMRLHRPAEAVAVLQPALRGPLDGTHLYASWTELQEALAEAWDAAGRADSAAVHYRIVASAWRRADPVLVPRREAAERRLEALARGQ